MKTRRQPPGSSQQQPPRARGHRRAATTTSSAATVAAAAGNAVQPEPPKGTARRRMDRANESAGDGGPAAGGTRWPRGWMMDGWKDACRRDAVPARSSARLPDKLGTQLYFGAHPRRRSFPLARPLRAGLDSAGPDRAAPTRPLRTLGLRHSRITNSSSSSHHGRPLDRFQRFLAVDRLDSCSPAGALATLD
ncbi:hypothetical protein CDD83_4610 [Cordyceps sp. RAO-2017]|nr:hypothetical protein CDD83_4610 [Cordyceps sp. RAO-2017]